MTDPTLTGPALHIGRRHFLIGSTFIAAAAATQLALPRPVYAAISNKQFEKWVPHDFGDWKFVNASGVLLPPSDALSDRLYDNLITRVYRSSNSSVMMLIAYNNVQSGILQVHRPEICYPAGGYTLTATTPIAFDRSTSQSIPANTFTATGPSNVEQVLYFTRLGSRYPQTWAQQRLAVAEANLKGEIPDGVLVRVSVTNPDHDQSITILEGFLREFLGTAPAPLRRMLLG